MPFNIGGSSGGLKCTITPGAGKRNSSARAKGKGPSILVKKVIRIQILINGAFFICTIEITIKNDSRDRLCLKMPVNSLS